MYSGRQMAAVGAAAVLMTTGVWPQQIERADFDASGKVDLDDLDLLRQVCLP